MEQSASINQTLPPLQQNSEISGDELLKELSEEARTANAVPSDIPIPDGMVMDTPPEVLDGPPPGGFTFPTSVDESAGEPEGPKPLSKKAAGVTLDTFLKLRNAMQSRLLAFIAKSDSAERYRLSDDDLDLLTEAYMPYAEQFGGVIPPWLMIVAVELMTTGALVMQATKDRSKNVANEKAVANPEFGIRINAAVSKPTERKRFAIDEDGYYLFPPQSPKQIKKADRTEKAELRDIEKLIEVNGLAMVQNAFPQWDFSKYINAN